MTPNAGTSEASGASSLSLSPDLGAHCSLSACNELDFLPILCEACRRPFCQHHAIPPSRHDCPIYMLQNDGVQDGRRFHDKFDDLLPDPHRCGFDREQLQQANETRALHAKATLEKHFGPRTMTSTAGPTIATSASTQSKASRASAAKPVSPLIALIKLKQRAQPIDTKAKQLKMEDRLYLTVRYCEGAERALKATQEVWLAKSSSGGKVLDQLATLFGTSNVNNATMDEAKRLSLCASIDSDVRLSTSDPISSLVQNGAELLLVKGGKFV